MTRPQKKMKGDGVTRIRVGDANYFMMDGYLRGCAYDQVKDKGVNDWGGWLKVSLVTAGVGTEN